MGSLYQRDGRWGIDYRDHRGRRVRAVVASDKGVAQRMLADAMGAAEKMRAGILTTDPREGTRPIGEHIEAYLGDLRSRGRDGMYLYIIDKRLDAAVFAQEWGCLND